MRRTNTTECARTAPNKVRVAAMAVIFVFSLSGRISEAAQICYTDMLQTSPASKFTDNGNGTVTDNRTGLMWSVCAQGQTWSGGRCSGEHATLNWRVALAVARTQNDASYLGYSDWRVPNKNELSSILELSCRNPAVNTTVFPDAANAIYWTSTPYLLDRDKEYSWRVVFNYGNVTLSKRTDKLALRLVRQ